MIPGTHVCPAGWTQEYHGYLMSQYAIETEVPRYRTEYICVDGSPEESIKPPGQSGQDNQSVFYYVRAKCGSLRCPPYKEDREVTCVVCTK